MKNLLNMLFSAARAKIMPLWIKLRMWTSPAFLRSKVLVKVREFFSKLVDVRPRDKRDYYPIFRWLVSKRLAFALVVALGLVSVLYITKMLPDNFTKDKGGNSYLQVRGCPAEIPHGHGEHSGKGRVCRLHRRGGRRRGHGGPGYGTADADRGRQG